MIKPDGSRSTFEFRHDDTNLDWVGANGLVTTIGDFVLWDRQFTKPTLGQNPEALRKRLTTAMTSIDEDGRSADAYAFGLFLQQKDRFGRSVYHRGSWTAFRSIYKRYPDRNFAYAVFCNRPDVNRDAIEEAIENIYLR